MRNKLIKTIIVTSIALFVCVIPIYAQGDRTQNSTNESQQKNSKLLPVGVNYSRDVKYSLTRGSIISTAISEISNEGNGDIGITIETLAYITCDNIRHKAYLERWNEEEQYWELIDSYLIEETKEDHPGEPFTSLLNVFTVKGQKTGYYYRVRGTHSVLANDEREGLYTYTDGIKITK